MFCHRKPAPKKCNLLFIIHQGSECARGGRGRQHKTVYFCKNSDWQQNSRTKQSRAEEPVLSDDGMMNIIIKNSQRRDCSLYPARPQNVASTCKQRRKKSTYCKSEVINRNNERVLRLWERNGKGTFDPKSNNKIISQLCDYSRCDYASIGI